MRSYPLALTLIALTLHPLSAQEFQGADAILKRLAEQTAKAAKPEKKADPVEEFRQKVAGFAKEADNLAPEQAAAQWLALFDAYTVIPNEVLYRSRSSRDRLSMQSLLSALPGPAAWDALAAAIDKRAGQGKELRDGGLRLFASVLRGDAAARKAAVEALRKAIEKQDKLEDYERSSLAEAVGQIAQALDALAGGGGDVAAAFARELTAREKKDDKFSGRYSGSIRIPDLVRHAGKEATTPLIKRALRLGEEISVDGKATRRLTAQLALKEMATLKQPVWELVEGLDDIPLYEALAKKFPKAGRDWERRSADAVYLLGLIAAKRTAEAADFSTRSASRWSDARQSLSGHVFERMQRQGFGREVLAFLREMLARNPSLPFWDDFIELSAHESQSGDALTFLREAMKKPDLAKEARAAVQSHYSAALLAANEVEEGVRVLRELIAAGPRAGKDDGSKAGDEAAKQFAKLGVALTPEMKQAFEARSFGREDSGLSAHAGLGLKLARLGRLLEHPDWVAAGLETARGDLTKMPASENSSRQNLVEEIAELLLDLGRGAEAEALVAAELLSRAVGENPARHDRNALEPLALLAYVYDRTGRPADVLPLLDGSPLWGAPDLAQLATTNVRRTPLLLLVARALAATDHKDEARKIARRMVQEYPGNDSAYALLLTLGGDDLDAFLDRLAGFDRFEERPLIWKAKRQFDAGRIEDAEKTIRAAIAIDPSDGEQGKGDRMRAYAVLGDILEKKGDAAQAKIMRGAVAAIRLSEQADDWWSVGLLSRAVKLYEEALERFADAYCIQSRLALRYSELGDFAKAEQFYRRAFELMPDSFGRVESHCFGCEGAFSGERAQGIAEKVFAALAVKLPDRPQVQYLFGYLRAAQGRHAEAAELYRQAVKLDLDYLNAWKNLQEIADETSLPAAERETAALAIFRLDPAGHHARAKMEEITDLRKLWGTIRAAEKAQPVRETGALYPLAAARAELEKRLKAGGDPEATIEEISGRSWFDSRNEVRDYFTRHALISSLGNFLDHISRRQ